MPNVTKEFVADPAAFMKKYVVFVANTAEFDAVSNKIGKKTFYFQLREGSTTAVDLLELRFGKNSDTVEAYWLPWKTKDTTTLDLGAEPKYFFTSQMTGCSFSVLTKKGAVKVAHAAGTLSHDDRVGAHDKLVTEMGGADTVRGRRLSVSESSGHGYSGQTAKPGSAFVYGVYADGDWKFSAQIVGAKLINAGDVDRVPLKAIKPAFDF